MLPIFHRYIVIDGHRLFYRESGPSKAPAVVLLHGYPTSSFMFRNLIPLLTDRYHVIAPDHLGFGLSDAPTVEEFDYTFAHLAELDAKLLEQIGVTRFVVYGQDYGAPIAWRIMLAHPDWVTGIISQNGNAYEEALTPSFWDGVWAYTKEPTPAHAAALSKAMELDQIIWQYTHGVPDPSVIDPEVWMHDLQTLQRPGNHDVQLALFGDYHTNVELYPSVHEHIRTHSLPVLAVWGRNDEIFAPVGATDFAKDSPDAEIHLLNGGHFLLESDLDTAAAYIRGFLGRITNA